MYGVGIVLVAVVVFGPAVRPWYVVWGLVPLAAVATHRPVRRVLAVCCAGLALVVLPDGYSLNPQRLLLALTGGLVGVAAFVVLGLMIERATWRTAWAATARHPHQ
ncbi:MAG: alpha,6-mannosyltransferase [Actinoplanes sp.]|nr:alpha,6-mannosyltransferase [Actinoplanes sp.]